MEYKDTYATWKVWTEGDVEGRTTTNGLQLTEGCLTDVQFSHKTFWQLLPNHCYVLGGLSALN